MQIGSSILTEHKQASLVTSCMKQKNHKAISVNLLTIPCYSDLLEDMDVEGKNDHGWVLVTTEAGWRTEMAKWIEQAWVEEEAKNSSGSNSEEWNILPITMPCIWMSKPKKIPLSILFGGKVWCPERLAEMDKEEVLMEALADQMEDEQLDDGTIEEEGDNYEP